MGADGMLSSTAGSEAQFACSCTLEHSYCTASALHHEFGAAVDAGTEMFMPGDLAAGGGFDAHDSDETCMLRDDQNGMRDMPRSDSPVDGSAQGQDLESFTPQYQDLENFMPQCQDPPIHCSGPGASFESFMPKERIPWRAMDMFLR